MFTVIPNKLCLFWQYRQIGNAVPVELATAVARSMGQILMFEYDDKDTEADEKFQKIVY